jgi:serine/threonine protein kinase
LQKVQADCWPLINRLKKLRNDKIAPYYQVDFTEKEVSMVMELSREGTLKKHLQKNGCQPEETASNLAESILLGLDYLHNAGVIHKDLKTTNVLMMPKNEIKLSDYGIAEIYDERLSDKEGKGYLRS